MCIASPSFFFFFSCVKVCVVDGSDETVAIPKQSTLYTQKISSLLIAPRHSMALSPISKLNGWTLFEFFEYQ
jgi:hypothetical protein